MTRVVFLGTPDMAVPPLQALVAAGHDVPLVVSRADKRRGRGSGLSPSPVKSAALALGLPVTDQIDDVLDITADLGVVVAYGRIIKPHVLAHLPMVNLHFSLLPRWRGAAPVERALLAGDGETGVCLMAVEEGLDTGGVFDLVRVPIGAETTASELRAELVAKGTELLLAALERGLGDPVPQDGEPTYAAKVDPAELEIDWSSPASYLHRLIRLGGAWTTFKGRRLKVWVARPAPAPGGLAPGVLDDVIVGTGHGALELVEVQPEGKARQAASDWRNGARPNPGDRLGS